VRRGLDWASYRPHEAKVALGAVGAYQMAEVLHAARRLAERRIPHIVNYFLEPGRLDPQCQLAEYTIPDELSSLLFPPSVARPVVITHTRPHVLWGLLGPLTNQRKLAVLGYRNEGGTLDTPGMLMVNGCTWAHCLGETAKALDLAPGDLLTEKELAALSRSGRTPRRHNSISWHFNVNPDPLSRGNLDDGWAQNKLAGMEEIRFLRLS
jgi:phosphoketolase